MSNQFSNWVYVASFFLILIKSNVYIIFYISLYCIIFVLDYLCIGLSLYWIIFVLDYLCIRLSLYWIIFVLHYLCIGLSLYRIVSISPFELFITAKYIIYCKLFFLHLK